MKNKRIYIKIAIIAAIVQFAFMYWLFQIDLYTSAFTSLISNFILGLMLIKATAN